MNTALANGSVRCRQYGQFLGNYFKTFRNLIWITGNDFQGWEIATNNEVILSIGQGILDSDSSRLQTVQLNYPTSQSYYNVDWRSLIGLNGVYTYYVTYNETLAAWNTNTMPVILLESNYEYEYYWGAGGTPNNLRRQEYWSMLSGALAGYMSGSYLFWGPHSDWTNYLGETTGLAHLKHWNRLFTNVLWYSLIPDQDHAVATAGYGTKATGATYSEDSDYVTTARSADGKLVVSYLPVNATLTIDMTKLAGTTTARWYDPTAGTYSTVSGSPFANTGTHNFTPTGNNSAGDADWVLLLEAP
jgi:hypothetical protein